LKQYAPIVVIYLSAIAMKILNIHKTITPDELLALIQQKLNPLFKEQRKTAISFISEKKGGAVEISQPEIYQGFLFRIEIKGDELHIARSEHYVDDVNSLTVESILNELFEELADNGRVTFVLEG
jgi:hypothetical protein